MELPVKFKEQMKELLQEEYGDYLNSFDHDRYYGLRVNTLKISVEEFLKISPFKLKPIPWTNDGFYYSSEDKPSKHPYYYAGLYYLQEPSAMLPAQVLPVDDNDIVLDTCAAPGGKSTKLATKLNHTGLLISNDISSSRCQGLLKNIELFGCDNAWVTSEDLTNMEQHYPETFDKILVDAPCSGEGMFRKEPDLHLAPINKIYGMMPGINMEECVRLYPHKIKGEGHFVALLVKDGETKHKKIRLEPSDKLDDCVTDFLRLVKLNKGTIKIKKDKVIWLSSDFQAYKGYRVLRSGLLLGQLKGKHFEPSQSLALALCPEQFKNVLNFSIEDERVIKYLKGETLDVKDLDSKTSGWTLVCVNNFPLGFAKLSKGSLKNKYAKGWRYQ